MTIALQLYTVRQQIAEDFAGTMQRIRDIGYRAVETYPFPPHIPLATAAQVLKSLDLEVVAMHCDLPLGPALPPICETADAFACRKIIWHGWPRAQEFDSLEGVRRLARSYNDAHAAARSNGLELGLHNHWWEFEPLQGLYPYQIFNESLDPDIFLEVDTYWVQTAGANPAAVIKELSPRVRFLHLKDGPAVHGSPMTALGQGVLDFPAILKTVDGSVDGVIELDECAGDIFQAIDLSFCYLQSQLRPHAPT